MALLLQVPHLPLQVQILLVSGSFGCSGVGPYPVERR